MPSIMSGTRDPEMNSRGVPVLTEPTVLGEQGVVDKCNIHFIFF